VRIRLRLYPVEDDGLIAFFDSIASRLRAAMVKGALRSGVQDTIRDNLPDGRDL